MTDQPTQPGALPQELTRHGSADFSAVVLDWYEVHGRKNLPWQVDRTAYRVWVSEIMLQQTQVATVTPFFERFTERFPDIATLASASEEHVLVLWSGLGYYARARNLHRCARLVAERHAGQLPQGLADLLALPGIGRSTAGAILSLAWDIRAPILDGNVKRLLCRYWGVEGWPGTPSVAKRLWSLAEQLTPPIGCGPYNQAMMDLGALVCTRSLPACSECPLARGCHARAAGTIAAFPSPRPRRVHPVRRYAMLIMQDNAGHIFLERRPPAGIWGGLWCFPMFQDLDQINAWQMRLGIEASPLEHLPAQRHTLSHFHLDLVPVRMLATRFTERVAESESGRWVAWDTSIGLGLPAPVRRLLDQLNPYPSGASST